MISEIAWLGYPTSLGGLTPECALIIVGTPLTFADTFWRNPLRLAIGNL